MCEMKPEDRLNNLLIKYKYSLIEEEALINESKICSEEIINKHKEIKIRKRNIKTKIMSLILTVTILTGVSYKTTKTIDKYVNNNYIESTLYVTSHSLYMLSLIYFIYKYKYKICELNKDLKYKINDFINSNTINNGLIEDIENVINENDELRKDFIKLYRHISMYDFDLMNEFNKLHLKESEMIKLLRRGNYERNI